MRRFVARYVDILVGALAFGAVAWLARRTDPPVAPDRVLNSLLPALLMGAYVGYLSRCYRDGKIRAAAAANDRSRET